MGATVVASTPTYALRMAQEAKALGIDLAGGPVKRLILSGEPAGSIPATKRLIEELWGAKAADTAGMTELGTIMIFECEAQPGGTHIIEDHYIEEVIDPETDQPVPYGEMGERVVTSFGRGFVPVIRYRTRDFVVKVPGSSCPCGRTFDIYEGGIRGRVDDMKLVRGTNVYPRAVEALVREHPEVDEFQIHLFTAEGIRDEIEVLVEVPDPAVDAAALLARLARELTDAHEGLRFGVRQAENGSLPRFELKAKRLMDERTVIGSEGRAEAAGMSGSHGRSPSERRRGAPGLGLPLAGGGAVGPPRGAGPLRGAQRPQGAGRPLAGHERARPGSGPALRPGRLTLSGIPRRGSRFGPPDADSPGGAPMQRCGSCGTKLESGWDVCWLCHAPVPVSVGGSEPEAPVTRAAPEPDDRPAPADHVWSGPLVRTGVHSSHNALGGPDPYRPGMSRKARKRLTAAILIVAVGFTALFLPYVAYTVTCGVFMAALATYALTKIWSGHL